MKPETVPYILLGINIAALVWGAAMIKASVDHLARTVGKLELFAESLPKILARLDTRLALLEDWRKRADEQSD